MVCPKEPRLLAHSEDQHALSVLGDTSEAPATMFGIQCAPSPFNINTVTALPVDSADRHANQTLQASCLLREFPSFLESNAE